jgi:hypothetical protein
MDKNYDYIDSIDIEYNSLVRNSTESLNLDKLYEYFHETVGLQIKKSLELQKQFNSNTAYVVDKEVIKKFIDKAYNYSCPRILKLNITYQQCFIFYIVTHFLYRYNEQYLQLDSFNFLNNVYYNNILNMCSKYLIQSRRFYQRLIKRVYLELHDDVKQIGNTNWIKFLESNDDKMIKNDIFYFFLINIIHKFDPMVIENLETFFLLTFKQILYFYINSKIETIDSKILNYSYTDQSILNSALSNRYKIYEEALQMSNIQLLCNSSSFINQFNNQIDNIKGLIVPNEIQKMYIYMTNNNNFSIHNEKNLLLKIYELIDEIEKIKGKLPLIHRLLKSIHIRSETTTFNSIDIQNIKNCTYRVLYNKFNNFLDEKIFLTVIDGISTNLAKSFSIGEFIDMFTMTKLDLSGPNFIHQLEIFLEMAFNKFV